MANPIVLIVQTPLPLVPHMAYPLRIVAFEHVAKDILKVRLEHRSEIQFGRVHEVRLPLPIYPTTITAAFFASAHFNVVPNVEIRPHEAIGRTVNAYFDPDRDGHKPRIVAFEPTEKGQTDDA